MPYSRTTWVTSETALSAANMNNIEDGIVEAKAEAATAQATAEAAQNITASMLKVIGNAMYPVGAIYMSYTSTSPATIFGGTWTQIKDRFILAKGDTYTASTGGAASQSYTPQGTTASVKLSAAQSGIAAHTHAFTRPTVSESGGIVDGIYGGIHSHDAMVEYNSGTTSTYPMRIGDATIKGAYRPNKIQREGHVHDLPDHTHTLTGGSVGAVTGGAAAAQSGHSHTFTGTAATISTIPPYQTVYVWRRTALAEV